jgi:hypothetical protein
MSDFQGIEAVQKKFGGKLGDPSKTRGTVEKITDKLRSMFEKATGYVPLRHCRLSFPPEHAGDNGELISCAARRSRPSCRTRPSANRAWQGRSVHKERPATCFARE